jgi:UDP-N-acetylmuramate dehydrogenase
MLQIQTEIALAPHTTMGIGGAATEFVVASTVDEIVAAIDCKLPILILGGGSNLVISDAGFNGRVIKIQTKGISNSNDVIEVAAGENWDDFVFWSIENGYGQLAPLTGIPGTVGATPIQNVGAYGTEVSEIIESVVVFDRIAKIKIKLSNNECKFSYRNSVFKSEPDRYVILSVRFKLAKTTRIPVLYDELATKLGVAVNETVEAGSVLQAVRELRASKGMLLDPTDRDTFSVGSFFLNPRVSNDVKQQLPADAPAWVQPDGSWKISAAWLISQAGFERGYKLGDAAISSKHTLALCNLANATSSQVFELAAEIEEKVNLKFGIRLLKEPTYIF